MSKTKLLIIGSRSKPSKLNVVQPLRPYDNDDLLLKNISIGELY